MRSLRKHPVYSLEELGEFHGMSPEETKLVQARINRMDRGGISAIYYSEETIEYHKQSVRNGEK